MLGGESVTDNDSEDIITGDTARAEDDIVKRGDIWVAELGKGVGSEQRGRRPVLVMQNNLGNKYSDVITILPLTSQKKKEDLPTHVQISEPFLLTDSEVLVEQVRSISRERFIAKVGRISQENQALVDDAFLIQHGFKRKFGNSIDNQYERC